MINKSVNYFYTL